MPKKKSVRRKDTKKKKRTKPARAKAAMRGRMAAPRRKPARSKSRRKIRRKGGRVAPVVSIAPPQNRAEAAGQSGGNERLSRVARADSQSVDELADEGQSFEAEVLAGVEKAEDAEESEVTTHEVPQDDVPSEYDGER